MLKFPQVNEHLLLCATITQSLKVLAQAETAQGSTERGTGRQRSIACHAQSKTKLHPEYSTSLTDLPQKEEQRAVHHPQLQGFAW